MKNEIQSEIEKIFSRDSHTFGTSVSPSKNGLIALARKGKDVWNAWASSACCKIDFSGYEFGPIFDFTDFIFPNGSDEISFKECKFVGVKFSRSTFKCNANFSKSHFSETCFSECIFEGDANFSESVFNGKTDFEKTKFLKKTIFYKSIFTGGNNFSMSEFHEEFNMSQAKLGEHSQFTGCTFHSESRFLRVGQISIDLSGSTFHKKFVFTKNKVFSSNFSDSCFNGESFFNDSVFDGENYFLRCEFKMVASFRGSAFFDHTEFDQTKFYKRLNFSCGLYEIESKESVNIKNISFSGCEFFDLANFDNRNFSSKSNFGKKTSTSNERIVHRTIFHKAPTFHECKFHQDTTFHGALFIQDYGDDAARAYRTLKLASERLKATRDEQTFFQLEMKAERPSLPWPRQFLSLLYGWSSDYGMSLWRPLATLIGFTLLFASGHGLLANACTSQPECLQALDKNYQASSDERTSDLIKYSLANLAPVPGLDRMQSELRTPLFGDRGWIAIIAIMLEIFHKLVTLVMTFLFALAVRNLFKMKS